MTPVSLHARRTGSGEPLVILHGLFGSGDNWRTLAKRFAKRFDVHVPDLRNHGRSPHTDEMSYRSMAEDVLAYMDRLRLDAANLVGHSMGGKVAMTCAFMYPEAVRRLVVADIAPRPYPAMHNDIFDALTSLDPSRLDNREDAETLLEHQLPQARVRQFLLKNLHRRKQGGFEWRMNLPVLEKSYDDLRSWPSFGTGSFPEPTLLIWGTESSYVTDDDRDSFFESFPLARFASLEAGHWLHADDPDGFYEAVWDFLTDS